MSERTDEQFRAAVLEQAHPAPWRHDERGEVFDAQGESVVDLGSHTFGMSARQTVQFGAFICRKVNELGAVTPKDPTGSDISEEGE